MKQSLRRQMREARRALSTQSQFESAVGLWRQFRSSSLFFSSKRIGLYIANDGEIDPHILSDNLRSIGRKTSLPCIDPIRPNHLNFSAYDFDTEMTANCFGIDEPSRHKKTDVLSLDLILLPLVAFDAEGRRIGMGGGFYDRTLAFKKHSPNLGPTLVGLAHECQHTNHIQTESWDIPLDGVLTDQRYIKTSA